MRCVEGMEECKLCGGRFAMAALRLHERWCAESKVSRAGSGKGKEEAGEEEQLVPTEEEEEELVPTEESVETPWKAQAAERARTSSSSSKRRLCKWGWLCRNEEEAHKRDYWHGAEKPVCRYGAACWNKNEPTHAVAFWHEAQRSDGVRCSIRTVNCDGLRRMLRRMGAFPDEGEISGQQRRENYLKKQCSALGMDEASMSLVMELDKEEGDHIPEQEPAVKKAKIQGEWEKYDTLPSSVLASTYLDRLEKDDIVCVQEHHLNRKGIVTGNHLSEVSALKWDAILCYAKCIGGDRKSHFAPRGYSGCATFFRPTMIPKRAQVVFPPELHAQLKALLQEYELHNYDVGHLSDEGRVVVTDQGDFLLFNVYLPSSSTAVQQPDRVKWYWFFVHALALWVRRETDRNRQIVLCGDLQAGGEEANWFFARHKRLAPEYHNLLWDPAFFFRPVSGTHVVGIDHVLVSPALLLNGHVAMYEMVAREGLEKSSPSHHPHRLILHGLKQGGAPHMTDALKSMSIMGDSSNDAWDFGEWADDDHHPFQDNHPVLGPGEYMVDDERASPIDVRLCNCGLLADCKRVRKDGPNRGRDFWTCPRRACNFFQWDDLGGSYVVNLPKGRMFPVERFNWRINSLRPIAPSMASNASSADAGPTVKEIGFKDGVWYALCGSQSSKHMQYHVKVAANGREALCTCPIVSQQLPKICKHVAAVIAVVMDGMSNR